MIITSQHIKSPLASMRNPKGLRLSINASAATLDAVDIPIVSNYYDAFGKLLKAPKIAKLGYYLKDSTTRVFDVDELCPEMPVPKALAEYLSLQIKKKPSKGASTEAVALLHVGRKGCVAPLHFDWDHDMVLHACLRGRRTFYFFPPESGWLLVPVLNTSALNVPKLSRKDKKDLLAKLGGCEITLQPGEAVLFPSMWWHSVYYDTASVGLSVRFSSRSDFAVFSVLPRSWLLQRIIAELFVNDASAAKVKNVLDMCAQAFFATYKNWHERYHAFNTACRNVLRQMGKDKGVDQWADEAFVPELAIAGFEVEDLYKIPKTGKLDRNEIARTQQYLFPSKKNISKFARAFVQYALTTRHGLAPQRGLIPIFYGKES